MQLLQVFVLRRILKLLVFMVIFLIIIKIYIYDNQQKSWKILSCSTDPIWKENIDFETLKISNDTGIEDGCYLVPNYIHFIKFGQKEMNYVEMITVLAALKNQKPDKIFFHHNRKIFVHHSMGKYWKVLMGIKLFTDILELNYVEEPEEIFGQPLNKRFRTYHASDITRIRILMKYGGIFLDSDTYIIKSLDNFRRYEMTLNWDEGQYLGTQLLLAHKDARFLKLWLESYRGAYRGDLWYYNAGERPTKEILWKRPELIHRVKVEFGADNKFIYDILQKQWTGWKDMYALHLLIRHQEGCKNLSDKATFPVNFNEHNIAYYPVTFREMAYDLYDFANLPWPKEYKS